MKKLLESIIERYLHIYHLLVCILYQPVNQETCIDKKPSPQEGLRVLKRRYEERIVDSVAYRGDTWGPKSNPKRRRLSSEDEIYHQKTNYEGPHPTV